MAAYVICSKNSAMCQEAVAALPTDYQNQLTLHYVEDPVPPNFPLMLQNTVKARKMEIEEKPDRYYPPTVVFHDTRKNEFIKHEGAKALMFLHQYKTTRQANNLNQIQSGVKLKGEAVDTKRDNVQRIMDVLDEKSSQPTTGNLKEHDIRQVIISNTNLQLKKLYNRIHNEEFKKQPDHGNF
jgi:hypothetical protein